MILRADLINAEIGCYVFFFGKNDAFYSGFSDKYNSIYVFKLNKN